MTDKSKAAWIDISVPLRDGMVHWPGDPPVAISRVKDLARGDTANLSKIAMGAHSGTHVDAPLHFISGGRSVDKAPLEALVGRARVIGIQDSKSVKPDELKKHGIRRGERVLFKTQNSARAWQKSEFVEDFVCLSAGAAQFLADRGARAVGMDYLSVGGYHRDGREVHKILLGAGVWLIEGLDLSKVIPGRYNLICLPLKIVQAEGAPARAILRPVRA